MTKYSIPKKEDVRLSAYFDKDYSDKANIVVWSGGADSTLLLFELAVKYGAKHNPVFAYSFVKENVAQAPFDKQARKKLKKVFKEMGLNIKYAEVKESLRGRIPWQYTNGLPQCMMWLGGLAPILMCNAYIHLGYIREDDFWHANYTARQAFYKLGALVDSKAEMETPYEYERKADILRKLKHYGLLDLIRYCEDDKEEPCGKCPSCKKHHHALLDLEKEEQECDTMVERYEVQKELEEHYHTDKKVMESEEIKELVEV